MARRTRPRPRRKREVPKSRLSPCIYAPDPLTPDDRDPEHPMCVCGAPYRHVRHQLPEAEPAQAEHRRRIGDDQ